MMTSDAARALVAARPTVATTCEICGKVTQQRARKRRGDEPLQPMANYCGPNHRARAAYLRKKAGPNEAGSVDATASDVS